MSGRAGNVMPGPIPALHHQHDKDTPCQR